MNSGQDSIMEEQQVFVKKYKEIVYFNLSKYITIVTNMCISYTKWIFRHM